MIRVVLADDHALVRTGIRSLLGAMEEVEVVGEASSGEEALELARRERPALAVLDVCLPGISGYEVCRELKDTFGEGLPVVFVSGARTDSYDRIAGLLIGGDDYLVKPFAPDELLIRVRRLLRRSPRLSPALASRLTRREREVLTLMAEGLDARDIAARLVLSPNTVAKHIEHVLAKLGARNRTELAASLRERDLAGGSAPGGGTSPMI